MSALECEVCGLAAMDLPDMVDPEMFFEHDDGITHCPVCDIESIKMRRQELADEYAAEQQDFDDNEARESH